MQVRNDGLPGTDKAFGQRRKVGGLRGRQGAAVRLGLFAWLLLTPAAAAAPKAYVVDLKGAVGPVSADFVVRGLHRAAAAGAAIVVLRIDTPGGLDRSMRQIIRAILSSPVPVAGYVAPSGARAASAGTYILYACQIAAMAPGTNVGAATPVGLFGGDTKAPESKPSGKIKTKQVRPPNAEMTKVTNDAVAYIRSLAKLHGRNADWAERAIRQAASLPADEALKLNVIDLTADNLRQLLAKLNGRTVRMQGTTRTLELAGATVVPVEPGFRTRLLSILTDPNVAFILLLLGAYGLIIEFSHPGLFAPGVVGAISLLLGLLALSIIPIDLAGLGLTVLGIGLMVAEAFVPSFGALGIGGVIAFVLGSLMAFDTPGFRLAWPVVVGATIVSAGLFLLVLAMLVRARRRPHSSGDAALLGADARVLSWAGEEGEVRALGERWRARADRPLSADQKVRVVGRDGLTLLVEPK
jgi:membrane-bound serine protease (ClpP class)